MRSVETELPSGEEEIVLQLRLERHRECSAELQQQVQHLEWADACLANKMTSTVGGGNGNGRVS